jgi:hypothetical protein
MRLAALFVLPLLATAADRVDLHTTEKVEFAPGGTVHIEGSLGDLNIEGWDQPAVEIDVLRSSWNPKTDLKKIAVTKQLSGKDLTIVTAHRRFLGAQVEYRIRVPRSTNLVVQHGQGSLSVFDVAGNIEAKVHYGDVILQLPAEPQYSIDARAKVGGIYTDPAGSVRHVNLGVGEKLTPAAAGTGKPFDIHVHVGAGGITILKLAPRPLLSLN